MTKRSFRPVGTNPPLYPRPAEMKEPSLRKMGLVAVGSLWLGAAVVAPAPEARAGEAKDEKQLNIPGGTPPLREPPTPVPPPKPKEGPKAKPASKKQPDKHKIQASDRKPGQADAPPPLPPGVPPLPREVEPPVPIPQKKQTQGESPKKATPSPKVEAKPAAPKAKPTKK